MGALQSHIKSYIRFLLIAMAAITLLLVAVYTLAGRLPDVVWLPPVTAYQSRDDVLYDLPVSARTVVTRYGLASVYETVRGTAIYEFTANFLLKASDCPNILNRESLDPSACIQQGTLSGAPVYNIERNDAQTADEQFVSIGHTFIFVIGNSGPDYPQRFKQISRSRIANYLATTSRRAAAAR